MKIFFPKTIFALTVSGALILSITGCTASHPDTVKSSDATSAPTASTAPVIYGDVIAGKTVTDSLGSYQQVKISSAASAMKLNKSLFDSSVDSSGFTDAQILKAQQTAVRFAVSEGTDSIVLDNSDAWPTWVAAHKQDMDPDFVNSLLPAARNTIINSDLTTGNEVDNPVFVRDGKPRVAKETIEVNTVQAVTQNGHKFLYFGMSGATSYRVTKAEAVKYVDSHGGATVVSPSLKKGTGLTSFNVANSFGYSLGLQGKGWKISGARNDFIASVPGWTTTN